VLTSVDLPCDVSTIHISEYHEIMKRYPFVDQSLYKIISSPVILKTPLDIESHHLECSLAWYDPSVSNEGCPNPSYGKSHIAS
jgi:hypothetical protein